MKFWIIASCFSLCPLAVGWADVPAKIVFDTDIRRSIARDFGYTPHHIIRESYLLHSGPEHDRPSWDLTSVLYAVRPSDGYFDLSPTGSVSVANDGFTKFTTDESGCHRYLKMNAIQAARVVEVQTTLVSQPPSATASP